MILPNVRASFGEREVAFLLGALGAADATGRDGVEERLEQGGIDALLDDPRTLNTVMSGGGVSPAPQGLVCYLLVRHALLEHGLAETTLADYLAALMLAFARLQGDEIEGGRYLVDAIAALSRAGRDEQFLLQVRLGDLSLWMSGLFPDHLTARVHRRGAPGIDWYEQMGATGYRLAASHREAGSLGLDRLYADCADSFGTLRVALNRVADRHLFPARAPGVDRLLRQVADGL